MGAAYRLLTEPLIPEEIFIATKLNRTITGVVEVDVNEFLNVAAGYPNETDPDVWGVKRFLSERLTGTTLLADVSYRVLVDGVDGQPMHIEVTGDAGDLVSNLRRAEMLATSQPWLVDDGRGYRPQSE